MAQETRASREIALSDRGRFKVLLAENLNYFGNLAESALKPVKTIVGDTDFEQLTCVGFNPQTSFLEATIAIKRPTGYNGDLCHTGSTEFVRFFVDYGSGWQDVGLAAVVVHDIPTEHDCAGEPDKPLIYAVSIKLDPTAECCFRPVLPRVRAILSWQWMPPAGPANVGWTPVWGNVLESHIQIKPRQWDISCLIDYINLGIPQPIKVPPLLEPVQYQPIPLPDPPPFKLAELAQMYARQPPTAGAAAEEHAPVAPHRFGLSELHPLTAPGGFDQNVLSAKAAEWHSVGIDLVAAVNALENTQTNVTYEQLECLGLDEVMPERLVASFRIKRPTGYSGDLCHKGSTEYIAFWADWDDKCEWTYLGTAAVDVHDISSIPAGGLTYSAILPVDLTHQHRDCHQPRVARVRAVLSWQTPPSTIDPDAPVHWGNRLDTHVHISAGEEIPPNTVVARIRNLGGIAIEDIGTAGNGMTNPGLTPPVVFAHHHWAQADAWGLGRACPFGGLVEVEGLFFNGYYYRVKVHKSGEPTTTFTVLADSFSLERWDIGSDLQVSSGGFFKYVDPALYFDRLLAVWSTGQDGPWEIQLDIATAPNEPSIIASSPWYHVLIDNTGPLPPPALNPTLDIHIAGGGDCKDFPVNTTITGTFVADDPHFGGWSLSTEPNTVTTPSNQPQPSPFLLGTDPAPGPAGHGWTLNTASPVHMRACGYVVRLDVSDRSIVNSLPYGHNSNHIEVGFCLRDIVS